MAQTGYLVIELPGGSQVWIQKREVDRSKGHSPGNWKGPHTHPTHTGQESTDGRRSRRTPGPGASESVLGTPYLEGGRRPDPLPTNDSFCKSFGVKRGVGVSRDHGGPGLGKTPRYYVWSTEHQRGWRPNPRRESQRFDKGEGVHGRTKGRSSGARSRARETKLGKKLRARTPSLPQTRRHNSSQETRGRPLGHNSGVCGASHSSGIPDTSRGPCATTHLLPGTRV